MKSNSSKGGGGYNELMFEDKKGSEEVRFHAQKDLDFGHREQRDEQSWQQSDPERWEDQTLTVGTTKRRRSKITGP